MKSKGLLIVLNLLLLTTVKSQSTRNDNPIKSLQNTQNGSLLMRNFSNITRIEDILNIFSIDLIASNWLDIYKELDKNCAKDMLLYLAGLQERKIWAMKSK